MLRDLPPLLNGISSHEDTFMTGPGIYSGEHHDDDNSRPLAVDPLDDVFGSAPPSPEATDGDDGDDEDNDDDETTTFARVPDASRTQRHNIHAAHPSDIPRLRGIHVTNGYREGIAASKEEHVQDGFDEGYRVGGAIGLKVGWCLGTLEGLVHLSRATDGRQREGQQEASALWREALRELDMAEMMGSQYFTPEGNARFDVAGRHEGQDCSVTPVDVAAAHPVVAKWCRLCRERLEAI